MLRTCVTSFINRLPPSATVRCQSRTSSSQNRFFHWYAYQGLRSVHELDLIFQPVEKEMERKVILLEAVTVKLPVWSWTIWTTQEWNPCFGYSRPSRSSTAPMSHLPGFRGQFTTFTGRQRHSFTFLPLNYPGESWEWSQPGQKLISHSRV